MDFIKTIASVQSSIEVQRFDKEKRNEIIKICKDKGLSIRQRERLTDISFGVLRRIYDKGSITKEPSPLCYYMKMANIYNYLN